MALTLERLTSEQLETVSAWLSDPDANRWLSSDWRGRAVTPVVLAMAVKNRRNRFFVALFDGIPAALVALSDIDLGDSTAMVWYVLGQRSLSGRGITTMAVEQLTKMAFTEMGLASLYAWAMEDNLASRRVLEKVGFREAGRLRRAAASGGQQVDRVYFDLTPEDTVRVSQLPV